MNYGINFLKDLDETTTLNAIVDTEGNEVGLVSFCYDYGDTLCDVEVVKGNFTEERIWDILFEAE